MKKNTLAALLLLLCPTMKAQTGSTTVAGDSADIYKNIGLGELTVSAQRQLVKTQDDRVSYDVTADPEAKTNPLTEMLKKVPFVTVEADGTIKVKGSTDFKIFRNGRPDRSFTNNAKELFKGIPASMVKRIEVITEPGAKYDAEGLVGILNIVMDRQSQLAGLTGTLSSAAGLGRASNPYNGTLYLTGQSGKLTVAPYVGCAFQKWRQTENVDYTYTEGGNRYQATSLTRNPGRNMWYGIDASLELDSCNLLTLAASGFAYNMGSKGNSYSRLDDAAGNAIYAVRTNDRDMDYRYFDIDLQLSYQHSFRRKGETLAVDYLYSTTRSHSDGFLDLSDCINYSDYDSQWKDNRTKFNEHTLQIDYERPFDSHHSLDVGGKYVLRLNNSDNLRREYLADALLRSPATKFDHTTDVGAAYAEYKYRLGGLTAAAGLRYETSRMKGSWPDGSQDDFSRRFNDLVPSVRATWRIGDHHALKLAYNMRLSRPGISYLNPFRSETPTSLSYGNPQLGTSKAHNITLGYNLMTAKVTFSLNAAYSRCDDAIAAVKWVEDGRFVSTYDNLGRNNYFQFAPYIQWEITPTTKFTSNSTFRWMDKANASQGLSMYRWQFNTYNQVTQKLPAKLTLSLSAYIDYATPTTLYSYEGTWQQYTVSLQRSFLKDDRLTAYLRGHYRNDESTHYVKGDYVGIGRQDVPNWSAQIGFSFRFGSLKASVKKTNKQVSNDDLMGRK